jgi:alpha-amylase
MAYQTSKPRLLSDDSPAIKSLTKRNDITTHRPPFITLRLLLCGLLLSASSLFAGVMMQGFYWNCPGPWYPTMQAQATALKNMAGGYGIDRIWFPVPQKSASGGLSMGYDPFDYYDLGSDSQNGGPGTHFGTQAQLKSAIAAYDAQGISCIADIVLNHRSGGNSETNPYTGGTSYTDFSGAASGMCLWHWDSFHPNYQEYSDEGTFGGYPDICYVNSPPYNDMKAWLTWLKNPANAGFDGWRYDYAKGYHSWVVHDMNASSSPSFSVGEYWDSNTGNIDTWVNAANSSAFDFALYYTMQAFCNDTTGGGNLANVLDPTQCYAAKNPTRAVTFCANHDTDQIVTDKMMAYAIIMTYQGYPCIFWEDYYNYGLATGGGSGSGWGNGINQLVWCREKLGGGSPNIEILKSNDPQCLIYGSFGYSSTSPGYIVVINSNPSNWKGYMVTTGNGYLKNQTLKAYAWSSTISGQNYAPNNQACDGSGNVQIWAAPRGYAVYSVNGL